MKRRVTTCFSDVLGINVFPLSGHGTLQSISPWTYSAASRPNRKRPAEKIDTDLLAHQFTLLLWLTVAPQGPPRVSQANRLKPDLSYLWIMDKGNN